jgi:hypothetical protein
MSLRSPKQTRKTLLFFSFTVFLGPRKTIELSASKFCSFTMSVDELTINQSVGSRSRKICIRFGMRHHTSPKRAIVTQAISQDLRNHGESPHATRHDYPAMAQDVAEFIEGHGLKDTTLIGHSM